jgi:hypothetical protein
MNPSPLLLRPEIFMNPAKEFRIGAWATPAGDRSNDEKIQ